MVSSALGVSLTAAVLKGVGVGAGADKPADTDAVLLGAVMAWQLRDAVGMVLGITFAAVVGHHMDAHVKPWRYMFLPPPHTHTSHALPLLSLTAPSLR